MSDPSIPFQAPEPEELSKLLSGYKVNHLIATGGMGAVYQATQTSLDRVVAIKLLSTDLTEGSFREQFIAEARAMAKLNHPNLIGIFDYGEAEGMPYIVMEYVAGKSLYYSSYQKAIQQSEAIRLVSEICEGLAHAHDHGIIHRDIKPANILLSPEAHAKIGDFGLASPTDQSADSEFVYGTPGYIAPEVLVDPTSVGKTSDIFAVGVILHQLLTGKMPDEDARTASRQSKCDPRLDRIIRKATHINPASRYQDAAEMAKELSTIKSVVRTASTKPQVSRKPKTIAKPQTARKAAPAQLATPASPPSDQKPAENDPPKVVTFESSTNWPFIRNLIIIGLLIPVLIFAWQAYQKKQEERDKENEAVRVERQNQERIKEAERERVLRMAAEQKRLAAERKAEEEETAQTIAEAIKTVEKTPREELTELRGRLLGGARSRFPKGTIEYGDKSVFLIEEPMSWSAASQFAESHGAHLATPLSPSDLAWFAQRQGETRRIWLGGGALGNNAWGWVTGEKWEHAQPSTTLGSCAAMTNSGVINARPNGEKLPFFIQWSKDGINKGSLEAQLQRLQGTLKSPSPAWPPGTLSSQGRSYLLIQRPVTWEEADIIATSGGGHLAVASDIIEKEFIHETLSSFLTENENAWLGGRLRGDSWTWSTGETWTKPDWRENAPDGGPSDSALRFISAGDQSGWDDANPSEAASAFLIEWSEDYLRAPANGDNSAGAQSTAKAEIAKLRTVGRKLLRRAISAHEKRLQNNQKDLIWELNGWLRSQPKSVQSAQSPKIENFKTQLTDGIIPAELPEPFPAAIQKIHTSAIERQTRFDNKLEQDISNIRSGYLSKLLAAKKRLEDDGLKTQAVLMDTEIETIGQGTDTFRKYFNL